QQGTAEKLYKKPVNKFVAGFLGSPPMNFFDGILGESDGQLQVSGDDFTLPLPDPVRSRIQDRTDKTVIVGIRPSAFLLSPATDRQVQLDLQIILSEYIGSQSVVVSNLGGQQILIEVDSDNPLKAHEVISFSIDPKNIYLFDPESEVVL
ncbi:MAG: sugar ABC transporter ATP-binding protein, partial [Desulfobulbia bacterium]